MLPNIVLNTMLDYLNKTKPISYSRNYKLRTLSLISKHSNKNLSDIWNPTI